MNLKTWFLLITVNVYHNKNMYYKQHISWLSKEGQCLILTRFVTLLLLVKQQTYNSKHKSIRLISHVILTTEFLQPGSAHQRNTI